MVKILVVLAVCVAAALSAPSDERRTLPALQHEEVHDKFGQYALRYVTAQGTVVSERGRLVPTADGTDHVLIYEGEYSFIGTDGKTYATKYYTDENGFLHTSGDHHPKAPEPIVVEPIVA